jgi:hypothetical protein
MKVLNLEFVAKEQRVFTLGRPVNLPIVYQFNKSLEATQAYEKEVALSAKQLVTLCVTLGEAPYIRYASSRKCILFFLFQFRFLDASNIN